MRLYKFLMVSLFMLWCAGAARGQYPCTTSPNVGFQVPNIGNTTTWGVCLNTDLALLDTLSGGIGALQIGVSTPTAANYTNWVTANTSSTVILNFVNGFNGQTIRVFCGAGDVYTTMATGAHLLLYSNFSCG